MENSLLIGNGLNRTLSSQTVDWAALLKEFAKRRGLKVNRDIPMPIEFELLMNEHLSKHNIKHPHQAYGTAKKSIAEDIKKYELGKDAIHYKIKDLKVDNILTTNYDYLIETACGILNPGALVEPRKCVLENPTDKYEKVNFYHIHGVVSKPNTICLGEVHYFKIIHYLQNTLNKKEGKPIFPNDNLNVLKIVRKEKESECWESKFFTTNLAIIGLSLDEVEYDLWWLISYRASLYFQNYGGAKSLIENNIVFYEIECDELLNGEMEQRLKRKYSMLKGMAVSVVRVKIKDSKKYKKAYMKILDDIKKNGICARDAVINV